VVESQNFAKVALPEILPQLLVLMQKQDEDAEDDEWNVAMAAGTCVGLLATVVGNDIVAPTIPFIEQNIQAGDWHQRDAAVMVFGSILDGPDEYVLSPLVRQALPTLIQMMNDGHASVRDSVAWTLGRITDLMIKVIQPEEHLPELVKALVFGLQQTGRIASSSCWSIKNLALGFSDEESDEATTTPLSPYYRGLMEALMSTSESRSAAVDESSRRRGLTGADASHSLTGTTTVMLVPLRTRPSLPWLAPPFRTLWNSSRRLVSRSCREAKSSSN
jgi:importin subunit beta-1